MAKKYGKEDKKFNYSKEVASLKENGPQRLYLLWGEEDYLREQYLEELKKVCIPEGEDSFSYKKIDGAELDPDTLRQAVDSVPFLTERSLVEIRDANLNKLEEPEKYLEILRDIPEYCTVALVQGSAFEPDGRLKFTKGIRDIASEIRFTEQTSGMLISWISKRFAAAGKTIDLEAAQRLLFVSGDLMSRLIPEIEKVAAYARGDRVTVSDVDAVAHHIPEAVIFEMTDLIAQRKYNAALSVLSELLADKNNEPIPMLAMLGMQMRKLYAARLALEKGLGTQYVMDVCGMKYEDYARKLINSARGFSLRQLQNSIRMCTEADYKIKSSSVNDAELLKEVVLRIAGEADV